MESGIRVIDGKAVAKEEENETEDIQQNEEFVEEVEVMKREDDPIDEEAKHDPWQDNNEQSDEERILVCDVEIMRWKRLYKHGDDSSDVSSEYDSDNYALSSWKDAQTCRIESSEYTLLRSYIYLVLTKYILIYLKVVPT